MKLVNQQLIKNTNLKLLYNSVFEEGGISRASLARKTGLSRTAVSDLIDELSQRGFLYDSGTGSTPGVGRNPNCLALCQGNHYVMVFEWEKEAVEAHLTDISGSAPLHKRIGRGLEDSYIDICRSFLDRQLPGNISKDQILGICFVLPAMIDPAKEAVFSTTFPPGRDGGEKGLIPCLKERFSDYTVAVLNDTACAAYAEKIRTGITEPDYAFIRFSQGIGAALSVGNRLLGGACASHVQFGHMSISPVGPPCSCGNRGCLELMLGEETLSGRLRRDGPVTYKDLGQAAGCGDREAARVIRDLAREFSIALSNLVCLVHPSLVVLGGKAQHLGSLFLQEIRESLKEMSFQKMTETLTLRYSLLEDDACYYGAMKYFFDIHFQFITDSENYFYIG